MIKEVRFKSFVEGLCSMSSSILPTSNYLQTLTPDYSPEEIIVGASEGVKASHRHHLNLLAIVCSAVVFLAILAWYDLVQSWFLETKDVSLRKKIYFALWCTVVAIVICILSWWYLERK